MSTHFVVLTDGARINDGRGKTLMTVEGRGQVRVPKGDVLYSSPDCCDIQDKEHSYTAFVKPACFVA